MNSKCCVLFALLVLVKGELTISLGAPTPGPTADSYYCGECKSGLSCVKSPDFFGSETLKKCEAICTTTTTTTTTTTPGPFCGRACTSDSDCNPDFFECNRCTENQCARTPPSPAPMAPPPPPMYACLGCPSGPECVEVHYGFPGATYGGDCFASCHSGAALPFFALPERRGTATTPGCESLAPGVVLSGLLGKIVPESWRLSNWSSIIADHGSSVVPIRVMNGSVNLPPFRVRQMTLREFMQTTVMSSQKSPGRSELYLQQLDILKLLPGLATESGLPFDGPGSLCPHLPSARFAGYFVSAKGVSVPLHVDNGDIDGPKYLHKSSSNLYMQVGGRKRFVLVPSSVPVADLHPSHGEHWSHLSRAHEVVPFCQGNETAMAEWPGFAKAWAQRIELELGPGDGLLIPSWWWHCTVALEDNAAINWWFDDAESESTQV